MKKEGSVILNLLVIALGQNYPFIMSKSYGSIKNFKNRGMETMGLEFDSDNTDSFFVKEKDLPKDLSRESSEKLGIDELLKEKLETILTQHKDSFTTMKNLEILAPKPETNVKPKKNIHNRLYMDSKYTKRLTKKPSQPVFSKKSPSNINYGNLLYEKSKATLNSK